MLLSKDLLTKNWIGSKIGLLVFRADRRNLNTVTDHGGSFMTNRKGTGIRKRGKIKPLFECLDSIENNLI